MFGRDAPTHRASLLSFAEFTSLVERHERELLGFLRSLVQQPEQASDLLQETFSDAWWAAKRGQPPLVPGVAAAEVRRWLFHAAYCQAMSALRRHRLIRWESLDTPGVGSLEVLSSPLAQLSTKDVTCLVLHVVEEFTAAETAQIMGDSPQAIAKRITRAKQRLLTAYVAQDAGHTGSKRL